MRWVGGLTLLPCRTPWSLRCRWEGLMERRGGSGKGQCVVHRMNGYRVLVVHLTLRRGGGKQ